MEIQTEEGVTPPSATSVRLSSPFKTPLTDMNRIAFAFYRLRWAVGYRLVGRASWTRKIRRRISYEAWISTQVKGWFSFMLWRLGIRIPFKATVAGQEFSVRDNEERSEFSKRIWAVFEPTSFLEEKFGDGAGVFRFGFKGKDLAFPYDGNRHGTLTVLKEFFVGEPFEGLDVEGEDVVDIGACIGDTPIYFALKGARRVIALEPFPATYAWAKRNISENGFDDKVTLLNEGAGTSGWMRLTRSETNFWANANPSSSGLEVRFNSLRDIITRFGIGTASLKLHGEGCEYELLEDSTDEDLAHFPQIVLKYHYGAGRIQKRLRRAGFTIVRKWDLHFTFNSNSSEPRYEAGFVLAKLANEPSK